MKFLFLLEILMLLNIIDIEKNKKKIDNLKKILLKVTKLTFEIL